MKPFFNEFRTWGCAVYINIPQSVPPIQSLMTWKEFLSSGNKKKPACNDTTR